MSIWNKVLVGVICFVCLGYFYAAARTLKTHQHWQEAAKKLENRIEQVSKQNERLANVDIRERRIALSQLLLDRGRVWYKCDPKVKVDAKDNSVVVTMTIESQDPLNIADNTMLYAFEEADVQKKGRYLGEFKVTKADAKQKTVVLVPSIPLTERQLAHLQTAQRPWDVYESMPRDNHEIFASLTDQEKEALLPAESRQEYVDDGKGDKVRRLRDYQVLFSILHLRRTLLVDQVAATNLDLKLVKDALAQAEQQETAAKKDVEDTKIEVELAARERDAVATFLKTVEKDYGAAKAAIDGLIKANKDMAGQIAKLQLEAARQIDQRTRAMAKAGAGG
jgi:hypothetical protein